MFRRFILFLLIPLFMASAAWASPDAERFAQQLVDEGLAILRDNSQGDAARKARLHALLAGHVDARKTALFTLGQYRRGADEQALGAFSEAFRDYALAIYVSKLDQNKAKALKVVGSVENKPGDVTVNAQADASGGDESTRIAVRLMGSAGAYKIVDVQVAGVWLSIEQRDQFATFLQKNNGDVVALTSHLRSQTSRVRSASAESFFATARLKPYVPALLPTRGRHDQKGS